MFRAAGAVDENELIKTYRQFGARLQGRPTPVLPWVDVATGSFGQGLPAAVGVGLAGQYPDRQAALPRVGAVRGQRNRRGFHVGGPGQGQLLPARQPHRDLDINRLAQRGSTELQWDLDRYAARVAAFGCRPLIVDGHELADIDRALTAPEPAGTSRPCC
jgi:transketolase